MMAIFLSLFSLLFDGIFTNFLPYLKGDLTLFTPLFSVTFLLFLPSFYHKDVKSYYLHAFLFGVCYDLFYTNLLFFDGVLFVILAYFIRLIYQNFETHFLNLALSVPFVILFYESFFAFVLFLFHLVPVTFSSLFYKIMHSILGNIIYAEVVYFFLKYLPRKYKKKKMN